MEIHKYHFILFNALTQHLNKGKNYQIDNIYALCNKYYQNIVQIKRHLRAASCAGRCLLTSCFVQGSQGEPPRRVRAVPWTAPSFPHACAYYLRLAERAAAPRAGCPLDSSFLSARVCIIQIVASSRRQIFSLNGRSLSSFR